MFNALPAKRLAIVALALTAALSFGGCSKDLKKKNEALWQENTQLRDQLAAESARADAADAKRAELLAQISELEGKVATGPAANNTGKTGFEGIGGVDVERGAGGDITVRVPGDVLFSSGQIDLKSTAKSTLTQVAGVLKREYPGSEIRVEGHTDSDPIKKSKWKDNLELSSQRAMTVARYLASQGVDDARMAAVGRGEHHPRASNSSATGKAQNRRVEIIVVVK